MSNYTQVTFFAPKDALITGNPSKLIKGSEVDPEFLAISTAVATKLDKTGDTVFAAAGSAGNPSLSFAADTNTGAYSVGADDWGVATNGVLRFDISTAALTATLPFFAATGSAANPSLTFAVDTNTGFYSSGADDLSMVLGGSLAFEAFVIGGVTKIGFSSGSATVPSVCGFSVSTTGLAWTTATLIVIAASQTIAQFGNDATHSGIYLTAGTSAFPSYSFITQNTDGFYSAAAGQIGISLAGAAAGVMAQGTFTITSTGISGSPSATAIWQRMGNQVSLFIPTISGTSTAATFTLTGLPAIIQPARTIFMPCLCADNSVIDNGASTGARVASASGTITMIKAGNSTNWTAANTKAIGDSTQGGIMLNYTVV